MTSPDGDALFGLSAAANRPFSPADRALTTARRKQHPVKTPTVSERKQHVCSEPGCPELQPCSEHGRDESKGWTTRDRKAQDFFRRSVFARSSGMCERCPAIATVAHHVRPGYEPECGLALCDECRMAVDNKARRTR